MNFNEFPNRIPDLIIRVQQLRKAVHSADRDFLDFPCSYYFRLVYAAQAIYLFWLDKLEQAIDAEKKG